MLKSKIRLNREQVSRLGNLIFITDNGTEILFGKRLYELGHLLDILGCG